MSTDTKKAPVAGRTTERLTTNSIPRAGSRAQGYQMPPCDPRLEAGVLGCIGLHAECFPVAHKMIPDADVFFEASHQKIWRGLCDWYETANGPVDGATIQRICEDAGRSPTYPAETLMPTAVLPANLAHHISRLLRLWARREIHDQANVLAECCLAAEGNIETVLREIGDAARTGGLIKRRGAHNDDRRIH